MSKDYIKFGPRYELKPRSLLIDALNLELAGKDTAISYALGKAAGFKYHYEGGDILELIDKTTKAYHINVSSKRGRTATKPVIRPKIVYNDGWTLHSDGVFVRDTPKATEKFYDKPPEVVMEHDFDNFVKKTHLMGEVHCG